MKADQAPYDKLQPITAEELKVGDIIYNPNKSRPDGTFGPVQVREIRRVAGPRGLEIHINPDADSSGVAFAGQAVLIAKR